VVSPILSNIYLDRLDVFVETVLIPQYTRGKHRKPNPEYRRIHYRMQQARQRGDRTAVRELRRQLRQLPSGDPHDPGYRRLKYTRYADDHLLGSATSAMRSSSSTATTSSPTAAGRSMVSWRYGCRSM
jgi:hypothetical protein